MRELHELLNAVVDEASFLEFVKALEEDRRIAASLEAKGELSEIASLADRWESTTIEDFLEAARAWAEATDFGGGLDDPNYSRESPWKRFALFLHCGKTYE